MPSLFQLARSLDGVIPRGAIAAAANLLFSLKGSADRRFSVDDQGNWVNRQREATFVSPDIFTSQFEQVRARVFQDWCYGYTPKAGDIVVDIGAGIGEEAVVFSKLVGPAGRVIAVEAHPQTFACLEGTIARSRLDNVIPVQCAITDSDGEITISDGNEHLANTIVEGGGGTQVRSRSLDSLLDELKVTRTDFMKMNIEGAERAAIKGMTKSAPNMRHVAISCHDFVADAGGSEQFRTRDFVEGALRDYGFEIDRRTEAPHPWHRDALFGRRPD